MISAVAKLISIQKLIEVGYFLILLVLTGFWAFGINARAAAGVEIKADQSFARIVVKKSDYQRGKQRQQGEYVGLTEIARMAIYRSFGKTVDSKGNLSKDSVSRVASGCSDSISELLAGKKIESRFLKPAGVFVTLSKNGKTRACWGSVYPRESNIARETVLATMGALSKEYRFKKISSSELSKLKVQVTVVRGLEAVSDIKEVNPFKDGVMVRAGGRGGVILPGEAVDAYYELVLAKLKAGIKPEETCQIYKIKAEIYE